MNKESGEGILDEHSFGIRRIMVTVDQGRKWSPRIFGFTAQSWHRLENVKQPSFHPVE